MRRRTKGVLLASAVLFTGLAFTASQINLASLINSRLEQNDVLIAEQMAYHTGVQAYLYGYPLVDMAKQMHNEVHQVSTDQQTYAPVNRFYRFPGLVGPNNAGNFRAPNNDTLYYTAWYDVSEEPLIIHTPDTQGRYYTIAVTNFFSEVTHIGRRTTGTEESYFALVGPNWQGDLPEGVRAIPVATPKGWLLGRMLVNGEADYPTAMGLVEQVWAAGLSEFTPGQPPAQPEPIQAEAIDPLDSLEFFQVMNEEIKQLPARPDEVALLAQFDAIGVGPQRDFDPAQLSEPVRQGLLRALVDGRAIVEASTARTIPDYNGWMISKEIGRYGFDYMHRASVVRGGYGNLPEESLYPATLFDANGELMTGEHRYRMHFPAGQLPPVNGFWSLAVYHLDTLQLAENPIQRYSIGDRTQGLFYNPDGSLTLSLQHERPLDPQANWLPTPAGLFMAVMRLYEPHDSALDGSYLLPRIERLD